MEQAKGSPSGDDLVAKDGLPARESGPWAKQKLKVLKNYIEMFTVGMQPSENKTHNWSGLYYIDLFAGPGICIVPEEKEEFDGSPLIASKTKQPFTYCYYVETNENCANALEKRLVAFDPKKIYKDDCNSATKQIIANRDPNGLYLAFIDPTGLDINFDTIRLLGNQLRCDLIINWWMSALTRNLPHWKKKNESNRLDRFFGTDEWKTIMDEGKPHKLIFQEWVALYRKQLEQIGYQYQPNPHIIKNSKTELYWLWFASKSPVGLKYWKEATKYSSKQKEFDF
jgi:three-Cys-motif partner protein